MDPLEGEFPVLEGALRKGFDFGVALKKRVGFGQQAWFGKQIYFILFDR